MKRQIFGIVLATGSIFILQTSCKKNNKDALTLDAQTQQFNSDANNYKSESDQADNDINNSLSNIPAFGRLAGIQSSSLCGVTIDSSQIAQKILFFNFDGITPCFSPSRTRSGQIKVELTSGNHWSDAGAMLTETYINYKVVRLSDNKSITFNGIKTVTNINGNNWLAFFFGTGTLKYRERAFNVHVTFDNAQSATWNSANTTQWNYTPSDQKIIFTCNGDSSLTGFSNVSAWGTNRYGQIFTTYYQVPLVSNTYCGLWRPNSGILVHHLNNADFTLTLGVDQTGNISTLACAYGFKVTWVSGGNTGNVILSY